MKKIFGKMIMKMIKNKMKLEMNFKMNSHQKLIIKIKVIQKINNKSTTLIRKLNLVKILINKNSFIKKFFN